MKIAHLSDLHFLKRNWNPVHFFSKRWLGNLNSLLSRRIDFDHEKLASLPQVLKDQGVSLVLITGDLTTTSYRDEFVIAREFIGKIEALDMEVLCIPGNHDHYTRRAYQERLFYEYFKSSWDPSIPFTLKEDGVTAKKITEGWTLVGLDTACATSWIQSTGYFNPRTEAALREVLSSIQENVILINHFPFFQHESPRKVLIRGEVLNSLIQEFPQVKIYCHGHTHRKCYAPLSPVILDPGSTAHRKTGGWNLIHLLPEGPNFKHELV